MNAKELFYARRFREDGCTLQAIATGFQVTKQAIHEALHTDPKRGNRLYLTREEKLVATSRRMKLVYRKKCGLPVKARAESGIA